MGSDEDLARLDERIKSLMRDLERAERDRDRAIKLAADELSRRLDNLNHAHSQAQSVQATYLPREVFEASVKEMMLRLSTLEGDYREFRGKMWLPMLFVAAGSSILTGLIVRMIR